MKNWKYHICLHFQNMQFRFSSDSNTTIEKSDSNWDIDSNWGCFKQLPQKIGRYSFYKSVLSHSINL